jgi:hypothetical protein
MTLSIMTLSILALVANLGESDFSAIKCHHAEFGHEKFVTECHYIKWHYAECHHAVHSGARTRASTLFKHF